MQAAVCVHLQSCDMVDCPIPPTVSFFLNRRTFNDVCLVSRVLQDAAAGDHGLSAVR